MREAAEDAETDQFNPQIAAASGAAGMSFPLFPLPSLSLPSCPSYLIQMLTAVPADALQVGKIKNKVLKLTGEVQQIKIKIAQAAAAGKDTTDLEASLTEEQTKLTNNIATDVKSKGQASQGVA
jgi:hypothetical protein